MTFIEEVGMEVPKRPMAKILTEKTPGKVRKLDDHKCFEHNSFLKGFYSFGDFCPICGESLTEDGILTSHKCSSCGTSLFPLEEMNYCPKCGEKFEKGF